MDYSFFVQRLIVRFFLYEKVGGFDETFGLDYEDNDFLIRCNLIGIEFECNPEVIVCGEQGYTKSKIDYTPDKKRYEEKYDKHNNSSISP